MVFKILAEIISGRGSEKLRAVCVFQDRENHWGPDSSGTGYRRT